MLMAYCFKASLGRNLAHREKPFRRRSGNLSQLKTNEVGRWGGGGGGGAPGACRAICFSAIVSITPRLWSRYFGGVRGAGLTEHLDASG